MDRRTMKKTAMGWSFALLVGMVLVLAIYTYGALHWTYSAGERVGYVQKLSRKGWLCKTWEGELAMTPVPGAVPEKFFFSVRDEQIAQLINQGAGKRVSLYYEQHKGVPTSCFGETEFYVVKVKTLD